MVWRKILFHESFQDSGCSVPSRILGRTLGNVEGRMKEQIESSLFRAS